MRTDENHNGVERSNGNNKDVRISVEQIEF